MLPRLFTIGDFSLPSYGLLVALGFLVGLWITQRVARWHGISEEKVANLAVYCALMGLVGAKIAMFLFDWDYYAQNPNEIFTLSTLRAAGVFQGGFVLSLAFALLYMKREGLPRWRTLDLFAPGIAIGHAIGRVGCFAAGCCWGAPTGLPWAVTYHNPLADGAPLNTPVHPSQLYESAGNLVLFGLLYRVAMRRDSAPGSVFGLYLITYSLLRFAVEFTRVHLQALPFGLPFSLTQWISLGTLFLGVALVWHRQRRGSGRATPASAV